MISIRLAKILINLAMAKPGSLLLDPFCGYGILLQEAMLMNINTAGFDINRECADASKANLMWTASATTALQITGYSIQTAGIFQESLKKQTAQQQRTLHGTLLKKIPVKSEAVKIIAELQPIYRDVLRELAWIVKGHIVIIVPRFRLYSGERIKFNFEKMLHDFSLKPVEMLPEIKMPIIYTATDSKIEREIWVLRKI